MTYSLIKVICVASFAIGFPFMVRGIYRAHKGEQMFVEYRELPTTRPWTLTLRDRLRVWGRRQWDLINEEAAS